VYQKHNPLYIKDIDGATPNPRMGIQSQYDYLNVSDIEGAQPKRIVGYTGVHPELKRQRLDEMGHYYPSTKNLEDYRYSS